VVVFPAVAEDGDFLVGPGEVEMPDAAAVRAVALPRAGRDRSRAW
jgi:hypothetical protein